MSMTTQGHKMNSQEETRQDLDLLISEREDLRQQMRRLSDNGQDIGDLREQIGDLTSEIQTMREELENSEPEPEPEQVEHKMSDKLPGDILDPKKEDGFPGPVYSRNCGYVLEWYEVQQGSRGLVVYCWNDKDRLVWSGPCAVTNNEQRIMDVVRDARNNSKEK